jgi:hypothetical protein
LAFAWIAGISLVAHAESDRDIYVSEDWKVSLEFPTGWNWTDQQSYPGILVSAVHRGGGQGRMTLAVARLTATGPKTQRAYVEQNRNTLLEVDFQGGRISSHPSGALILDATAPNRTTSVRQAYFAFIDTVYVLTLAAPITTVRSYGRAFDDTLRRMVASVKNRPAPATPAPAPVPAGATKP